MKNRAFLHRVIELHEGLVEKVEVEFWIDRVSIQKFGDSVLGGLQCLGHSVIFGFAVFGCFR